jgi:deoxycytidine triphosphate deaminase
MCKKYMIISKKVILDEYGKGNIIAYGVDMDNIKDQSIDVSLGEWIYITEYDKYGDEVWGGWHSLKFSDYTVGLGEFVIAHTDEFIGTKAGSNLLPSFKLKSSAGRHGIIHTLAGHGEVGFHNRWAMEFIVGKPVVLKYGMYIGQIYFTRTEGAEDEDYSKTGSYQNTNNLEELIKNWKKEDLLPKDLKVK